jgi:hypothetical protein
MVDNGRGGEPAMVAIRMRQEEHFALALPTRVIAALGSVRAATVVFGLAGAICMDLMFAALAVSDDATARSDAGRTHRH